MRHPVCNNVKKILLKLVATGKIYIRILMDFLTLVLLVYYHFKTTTVRCYCARS